MILRNAIRGVTILAAVACIWLVALPGEAAHSATGPGKSAAAATTVDGFLDVPWGAAAEQIDAIMQAKGFQREEASSTRDIQVYSGDFSGYHASLQFHLLHGVFFRGEARLDDDTQSRGRWQSLDNMFTQKYGQPELGGTRSEPAHIWDGLKAAVAWDDVEISLAEHFLIKKPVIVYRNKSLEARLQTEAPPKVDGFLGIPWGATAAQIDKAMAAQGFSFVEAVRSGRVDIREYKGTFAGYPCTIQFSLKANTFFFARVADICMTKGTGGNQKIQENAEKLEMMISAMYGLPSSAETPLNPIIYNVDWNGLPSSAAADKVNIRMLVKLTFDEINKGYIGVNYLNVSLRDQLLGRK